MFWTFESYSILRWGFWGLGLFCLCIYIIYWTQGEPGEKGQPTIAVPILRTRRPTEGHFGRILLRLRGKFMEKPPQGFLLATRFSWELFRKNLPLLKAHCPHYMLSCGSVSLCPFVCWALHPRPETTVLIHFSGFPQTPAASSHSPNLEAAEQSKVNKAFWIGGGGHCPHSRLGVPEGKNRGWFIFMWNRHTTWQYENPQ